MAPAASAKTLPPPPAKTFSELVRWIAKTYHRGKVYPIANRVGMSPAIIYRYYSGSAKEPKRETVRRFCAAYHLPTEAIESLLGLAGLSLFPIMNTLLHSGQGGLCQLGGESPKKGLTRANKRRSLSGQTRPRSSAQRPSCAIAL